METIAARLAAVHERLAAAARHAARPPEEITLVGVTKTQPPEAVSEALAAGLGGAPGGPRRLSGRGRGAAGAVAPARARPDDDRALGCRPRGGPAGLPLGPPAARHAGAALPAGRLVGALDGYDRGLRGGDRGGGHDRADRAGDLWGAACISVRARVSLTLPLHAALQRVDACRCAVPGRPLRPLPA